MTGESAGSDLPRHLSQESRKGPHMRPLFIGEEKMDPRTRRQFYAKAGIADPIPPIALQREWQYIDDRLPPEGEADGEFKTFTSWVNHAASWIGWTGAKCFDAKDRPCRIGGDFMRARDEDSFPVRWYFPDRFPAPVIPTKGELAALRYLQGTPKADIRDIRKVPGAGNMSWKRLALLLGEGNIGPGDDVRQIGPAGLDLCHEYTDRATRARNVR